MTVEELESGTLIETGKRPRANPNSETLGQTGYENAVLFA